MYCLRSRRHVLPAQQSGKYCMSCLERQIVLRFAGRSCWRNRRSGNIGGRLRRNGSGTCDSGNSTPCTDVVEPTALIFMGVDVERYRHFGTYLYIHFLQAVFAENPEYAFTGILFVGLNDKFLRHPFVSGTCRRTRTRSKSRNDFSCNFHLFAIKILYCKICREYTIFFLNPVPFVQIIIKSNNGKIPVRSAIAFPHSLSGKGACAEESGLSASHLRTRKASPCPVLSPKRYFDKSLQHFCQTLPKFCHAVAEHIQPYTTAHTHVADFRRFLFYSPTPCSKSCSAESKSATTKLLPPI